MKDRCYFSLSVMFVLFVFSFIGCSFLPENVRKLIPEDLTKILRPSAGQSATPADWIYDKTLNPIVGKIYTSKVEKARKENKLLTEGARFEQIKHVFLELKNAVEKSPIYGKSAKKIKWTLNIIDNPNTENAFAWPGGKILIYTGIFEHFVKNDAELAAVLGHEITHLLERHAIKRIEKNLKMIGVAGIVSLASWKKIEQQDPKVIAAVLTGLGIATKLEDARFTRNHEKAADIQGLFIAADAGYHPNDTLGLWLRFKEQGASMFDYFKIHPNGDARFNNIARNKNAAIARYEHSQTKKNEIQAIHVSDTTK